VSRENPQPSERDLAPHGPSGSMSFDAATVVEAFERHAFANPDQLAIAGARRLTYGALSRAANDLAASLAGRGLGRGDFVVVWTREPTDAVVGALAAMRAGASFIPLDSRTPGDRVTFILHDSGARALVAEASLMQGMVVPAGVAVLGPAVVGPSARRDRSAPDLRFPAPDDVAYAIYTSGSTGFPKGVEITHANLMSFVEARNVVYGHAALMSPVHPPSFDPFQGAVAWALATGGALLLLGPEALLDPRLGARTIEAQRPTHLSAAASVYRYLVDEAAPGAFASLQACLVGGEVLGVATARRHHAVAPHARLFNEYGPTECTVLATVYEVPAAPPDPIPIGVAVPGATCHVLDPEGAPCAPGVAGELYIGGSGVARGYLGRPELTARNFVPDPFAAAPGARMFRTGDRVRWNDAGQLEFLGRTDFQLKLRGNRIEPEEIEAAICRVPGVAAAVVVLQARTEADPSLVAFVVANGEVDAETIRRALTARLPAHMIPSHFERLDELPLNASGKADRAALAAHPGTYAARDHAADPPRTAIEEALASTWAEALGLPGGVISRSDDFFALGGHSLLIMKVRSRILRELRRLLPLEVLFSHTTLSALATAIGEAVEDPGVEDEAKNGAPAPQYPGAPIDSPASFPLAPIQEIFHTIAQLDARSDAYTVGAGVRVVGPLDPQRLREAAWQVVAVNDVLRGRIQVTEGRPFITIEPRSAAACAFDWSVEKATSLDDATALQRSFLRRAFDLHRAPLIRFQLIEVGPDEHLLTLAAHHVIFDGLSVGLFLNALWERYAGRPQADHPPPYASFADVTRRRLGTDRRRVLTEYWNARLSDLPEPTRLPATFAFPPDETPSRGSAQLLLSLKPSLISAVRAFSRSRRVTPFVVMLTALKLVLARRTGTHDVVLGTPVSVRSEGDFQASIGCLINTVILRTQIPPSCTFDQLVAAVEETVKGAVSHGELPYTDVLGGLSSTRGGRPVPPFSLFFNYIDRRGFVHRVGDLLVEPLPEEHPAAKFDLTVYVHDWGDRLELQLLYDTAVYDQPEVQGLALDLDALLTSAIADASRDVRAYALGAPPRTAVAEAPDPPVALDGARIQDGFLRQASLDPSRTAISEAQRAWTYGELAARSGAIAGALHSRGLQAGDRVAIFGERGAMLVAAVAGALRLGCVFVLLDPEQPPAHTSAILEGFAPRAILDLRGTCPVPPGTPVLRDAELAGGDSSLVPQLPPAREDTLAYAVYTSGTTGVPRGILGGHRPVVHFLAWQAHTFALTGDDRFAMLSGIGHDPLLRDIFAPLSLGATLCVPPPGARRDPHALASWLDREGVTAMHLTPPLEQVLAAGAPPVLERLRAVFFGGDRLTWSHVRSVRRYAPHARIVNGYGLSETPQLMTWHEVTESLPIASVPIGRGLPGVDVRVESPSGTPCAVGELGEIVIRSRHLARGYVEAGGRLRELTRDGVFRTGDLGRMDARGLLHHARRADSQVKIRGYRVDLAGVEAVIAASPGVAQARVLVTERTGEASLCAFVVPGGAQHCTGEALRASLAGRLSSAAVPQQIFIVPRMPLTPNGKLDDRQLLAEAHRPARNPNPKREARTQTEDAITRIWEEILGVTNIGLDEDVFELGASSLQSVQMVSRLRDVSGCALSLETLMRNATVAKLVEAMHAHAARREEDLVIKVNEGGCRPPFWMMHPIGGHVLFIRRFGAHVGPDQPVFGIQAQGLDGVRAPLDELEAMAALYVRQIKQHQPTGPYHVGGPSFGGRIAYEVAQQLMAAGDDVRVLAIFDAWPPGYPRRTRLDRWLMDKIPEYVQRLRRGSVRETVGRLLRRDKFGYAHYRALEGAGVRTGSLNDSIRRVIEANERASRRYRFKRYPGTVTIFRANQTPSWIGVDFSDPTSGWSRWAKSCVVIGVDCAHQFIMDEPAVAQVARELNKRLLEPRAAKAA